MLFFTFFIKLRISNEKSEMFFYCLSLTYSIELYYLVYPSKLKSFITLAGIPATLHFAGTSFVTTPPAAQ